MLFGVPHLRYHLYRGAVDMRKGFDGLSGLVRNELGRNPMNGELFIFINRRGNLIKLLVWDITGYAVYYKRLERGTFEIPHSVSSGKSIILSREQLMLIMEGISLKSVRMRRRYSAVPNYIEGA
jgi:transposase